MKTYVLTVSRVFPKTHKRSGERTYFEDKILKRYSDFNNFLGWQKLHTIRANKKGTAYENWSKKVKEVQEGKAILSIRYWSGKPYNSKQVEICQLDKDSGVGVQKIFFDDYLYSCLIDNRRFGGNDMNKLMSNDGLSHDDFEEWFKGYDLSKPMVIIQFTSFRY